MKDEDILIKLKRKFGKDELVSSLNNRIKKLEIEKGELLSEIDFLNYQNKQDRYQYRKAILQIRTELLTNKKEKNVKRKVFRRK